MWIDNSIDILEALKSSLPVTFIVILPFLMVISPVNGAQNFPVYRVNQFDLAGNTYGSRSTLVNMEARSLSSSSVIRKCVVARLTEINLSSYRQLMDQNAGALLILLPSELGNLSSELREQFLALEDVMLTEETVLPVYFAIEDTEVLEIYESIKSATNTDSSPTATTALLQSVSANGFQMSVNIHTAKKLDKYKAINLHGVLEGSGNADRLPTVLIAAHYDSMGAAPGLSYGADSNGSGVAALLELMRIFSRLFNSSSRPNYNVAFLLSGAAKMNYFGTRKWLEEMKESNKFPYLSEVESVICLDSLSQDNSKLFIHVSKPPKEGTSNHEILKKIQVLAAEQQIPHELIHKKIHLGEVQLAWEHEQFAMSKMAGMTISSLSSHKSRTRTSALDTMDAVNKQALGDKVKIIGEALARYMFVLPESNGTVQQVDILQHDLAVQPSMISAWLNLVTSEPRAAQLIDDKSPVLNSLEQAFNRYLKSVAKTRYTPDKRDPEFVLYDSSVETMHVYNVKPAVFDLVLALAICGYLAVIYLLSQAYPSLAAVLMNKQKKA